MWRLGILLCCLLAAASAGAETDPRFCPSRPSLGSSACTTEPGQIHLEVSGIDWQRDTDLHKRDNSILFGDFQARIGVGPTTEAQIGWTPYGRDRVRDRLRGAVERQNGAGDLTLGVRQNLRNPDGKGLSYGVEASVTLPTGHRAIGGGDWAFGVDVPVSYRMSDLLAFTMTVEGDAAVDADAGGRHFAGSAIGTIGLHPAEELTLYTEGEVVRDLDRSGHATQVYAAQGVSLRVAKRCALWAEAVKGLSANSPDLRIFSGFTFLF